MQNSNLFVDVNEFEDELDILEDYTDTMFRKVNRTSTKIRESNSKLKFDRQRSEIDELER